MLVTRVSIQVLAETETDGGHSGKGFKLKLKRLLQQINYITWGRTQLQQFGDSRGLADPLKFSEVGSLRARFQGYFAGTIVLSEQIGTRASGIYVTSYAL